MTRSLNCSLKFQTEFNPSLRIHVENTRCDRCQSTIDTPEELHYAITIEIEAEGYIDDQEFDSSDDKLARLEDLIESADEICSSDFGEEWFQQRQYLLCKACYAQYIQNPLGKPAR